MTGARGRGVWWHVAKAQGMGHAGGEEQQWGT